MANYSDLLITINLINYYFDKCNNEYRSGLLVGGLFIYQFRTFFIKTFEIEL